MRKLSQKSRPCFSKYKDDGFYRDLFKKFKGNFERIFLTGVSPVTLDDLTSGFNIGWNLSTTPEFDKMLGFSTEDVIEMFKYYKSVGMLPEDTKKINHNKIIMDFLCVLAFS